MEVRIRTNRRNGGRCVAPEIMITVYILTAMTRCKDGEVVQISYQEVRERENNDVPSERALTTLIIV